jgi:hypothetical protein
VCKDDVCFCKQGFGGPDCSVRNDGAHSYLQRSAAITSPHNVPAKKLQSQLNRAGTIQLLQESEGSVSLRPAAAQHRTGGGRAVPEALGVVAMLETEEVVEEAAADDLDVSVTDQRAETQVLLQASQEGEKKKRKVGTVLDRLKLVVDTDTWRVKEKWSSELPPVPEAECPQDCNTRGRCHMGKCVCFPGYAGPSCNRTVCPNGCSGQGVCNEAGTCDCYPGFGGSDCSDNACPQDCNGNGDCSFGICFCRTGYTGDACENVVCPNMCSLKGLCDGKRCRCFAGFDGADCSEKLPQPLFWPRQMPLWDVLL